MKGFLSVLNRCQNVRSVVVSSGGLKMMKQSSSILHNKSSFNCLSVMNNVVQMNKQASNYSTSVVGGEGGRPLNHLEQSMVHGITSVIQANNESLLSGDFVAIQKRYEQIYNTLTKSNTIQSQIVKEKILELVKISFEQTSLIEKKAEKEQIILPLYKLQWKIASVLQSIGEFEEAVKSITDALTSVPKEMSEEIPQMKIIKASILNSMGALDQAFELHNKALTEIGPKVTWKNGAETAIAFHELGEYYLGVKGETGKAVQSFEKSLSISEGFYGWMTPQTTKTALILSRLYLETNKIDFSVILGEKALVGIELFLDLYEAPLITISGSYLARAYERKGFYPFQQSTISRVYNILRRKKTETDTQTYMECVFKLENMMGSCRFFQGHLKLADQTFSKLDHLAESVMPEWLKKDSEEAQFELAYMKYFKGVCKIGLKENSQGVSELEQAKKIFLGLQREDWASHCDQYIKTA